MSLYPVRGWSVLRLKEDLVLGMHLELMPEQCISLLYSGICVRLFATKAEKRSKAVDRTHRETDRYRSTQN